jgi:cytochrome c5
MCTKQHNTLIIRFLGFIGLAFGIITIAAADGQSVYNSHCAMCHASGVSGAPKPGDTAAWQPRGNINTLVQTAISGKGAMPPKGGCDSCSEGDIKAAVEYMKK